MCECKTQSFFLLLLFLFLKHKRDTWLFMIEITKTDIASYRQTELKTPLDLGG